MASSVALLLPAMSDLDLKKFGSQQPTWMLKEGGECCLLHQAMSPLRTRVGSGYPLCPSIFQEWVQRGRCPGQEVICALPGPSSVFCGLTYISRSPSQPLEACGKLRREAGGRCLPPRPLYLGRTEPMSEIRAQDDGKDLDSGYSHQFLVPR
jgi:hypothetical protein